MVKNILVIITVVVFILIIIVILQPSEFSISRSASFKASISQVFSQVNDLHNWQDWSPWAKLDPQAKIVFQGAKIGVGAGYRWSGNDKIGEGSMMITESQPYESIKLKLEFTKPFAAINTTLFTFKTVGSQTLVTWTMTGKNNFIGKAMGLLMNCDKMVGSQFEQGFKNIRAIVER